MKKVIPFIIILSIIGSLIFYWSNKPNNQVIALSDEIYLVIEDKVIGENNPVILEDKIIYLSYDIIKEYIDPNLFYDEGEETIIFTNKEKVKRYKIDSNKASINNKEFYITNLIKKIDNRVYIPLDIFINDYNIDISYFEDTKAVVLDYKDNHYLQGETILEGGHIRTDLDIKSPIILKDILISTPLIVYAEYENWYRVRTYDGISGFIEKRYIKLNYTKDTFKVEIEDNQQLSQNNPIINLTWDYTYGKVKNTDNINFIPGINVISPTWFSITDNKGTILDKGNFEYVVKYKELGYEIWPLINNNFDPDLTHELLSSSSMREKLIKDIINIYGEYGFQGINLDFENVHLDDKDFLTQFVRELYPIFKERGMKVSIDVTPISTSENWSLSFDRERLSETVDYIMLMAYDQHWASSPVAGSVAQYSWVEKSLIKVFEVIPKEKIILGVPFYSRLWKVENVDETEKVSSQALSMESAKEFIEKNNIQLQWDEESGQYYGETKKEDITYKIWLEDAKSLNLKATLIHKYGLGGIASWRKGFETIDVWNSIDGVLN
ncbi:glycoside hydrolase [Tissierella sp. MSJ-40]|uniref:Glycoside hydrolase n=1 Tax=Tissierella simiarum TaxID=2841534 RepID=A0ABS6EB63_9FIRM|nr:glycosyl hydrolase family 18 protein [Tissierella simiarum]MBU5439675.1 glycoside hydrolase [Tissierella simiarum]